ncbi:MAG: DUF374 domain-containing protein [Bacteroidetes bacterium]|nr:DUF374 domain-containing protein [Bacteroidota bacterium]
MSRDPARWKMALVRSGLRLLGSTWRIREAVPEECEAIVAGMEPAVIAFWHGGMLPLWYRFRLLHPAAVVSASSDGALLADYLARGLGYGLVIRGSSSRGGGEALRAMADALASRSCLITPDGPRGPVHEAKPGALVAALRSGRRVLLAGWSCRHVVRLGSWDAMHIPYPFSRINIRYCTFDGSRNMNGKKTTDMEEGGRIGDETLRAMGAALNALSEPKRPVLSGASIHSSATEDAGSAGAASASSRPNALGEPGAGGASLPGGSNDAADAGASGGSDDAGDSNTPGSSHGVKVSGETTEGA